MKKVFYAVAGLAVIISAYLVFRPTPLEVEVSRIKRGDFAETLTVEGKVRSRLRQIVYAFASGTLESTSYKVGDAVKKDDKIMKLEWDKAMAVKSPMDGVITKIFRDSAGPINRGEPLFEVSSLSQLEVVAELLTPEAVRLSPKGKALIKNWGGTGELGSEISQISKAGAVKLSALGVEEERTEVKLELQSIPEDLKKKLGDNYHVDVEFTVSQKKDVLSVPLSALFKNNENWAVFLKDADRAKLREIKIGEKNNNEAVVLDGLNEGDTVILFPGDKIREGTRVK